MVAHRAPRFSPYTAFHPLEGQKKCPSLAHPLLPVTSWCKLVRLRNRETSYTSTAFSSLDLFDLDIAFVPTEIYNHVGSTTPQPQGRVPSTSIPINYNPPAAKVALPCNLLTRLSQRRGEALKVNISAGEGLQDVLKSNLGPLGTIKMCVLSEFSYGDVKLTVSGLLTVRDRYKLLSKYPTTTPKLTDTPRSS